MISENPIRKWQHKDTKKIVRATPWWTIPEPILTDKDAKLLPGKWRMGCLVQVGWLIENEGGVWLGVGPKAEKAFEDLGEWKQPKKKKRKKK